MDSSHEQYLLNFYLFIFTNAASRQNRHYVVVVIANAAASLSWFASSLEPVEQNYDQMRSRYRQCLLVVYFINYVHLLKKYVCCRSSNPIEI